MKEISLSQRQVAFIDDEDFEKILGFHWYARKARNCFYAQANDIPFRPNAIIQMHNLIIGEIPAGMLVDHKDRNGLNNQKDNLRLCTPEQNCANRTPWGKSKYLGVSKVKGRERWRAFIGADRKNIYLGIFRSEIEAALAYNDAAKIYKGEFANLNIIPEDFPFTTIIVRENDRYEFS